MCDCVIYYISVYRNVPYEMRKLKCARVSASALRDDVSFVLSLAFLGVIG